MVDLLQHVASHLQDAKDVASFVCCFHPHDAPRRNAVFQCITRLNACSPRTPQASMSLRIARSLGRFNNLTRLDISNPPGGSKFVADMHHLSVLSLKNIPSLHDRWVTGLQQLPSLTSLDISGAQDIWTDEVVAIATHLSQLQELDLSSHWRLGRTAARALGRMTNLTSLNISYTGVRGAKLSHLSALTRLTRLVATNNQIDDFAVAHVSHMTSLKSLDLRRNPISQDGAAVLMIQLTRLESLNT